jgi:hypothetical protein
MNLITAPLNEYVNGNSVTFTKAIYLFSDIGENNDSNGGLYKIHPYTGNVLEVHNSGIYHSNWSSDDSNWSAAAWSPYFSAIGFVRGVNLLYVDPNSNYQVKTSQILTNINSDNVTIFPVHDLVFNGTSIYRLQKKITLLSSTDNGAKTTYTWSNYNFHQDSASPYTFSIDITGVPRATAPQGNTFVFEARVKDQFDAARSGLTVTFSKTGDPNATIGFYTTNPGSPDSTVDTNSSGIAVINYLSGSYDYAASEGEGFESMMIHAKTTGGSTFLGEPGYGGIIWEGEQGSTTRGMPAILHKGFWSESYLISQIEPELESPLLLQQTASGFDSSIFLESLLRFQFPGGDWIGKNPPNDNTTLITQLSEFESEQRLDQIDEEFENEIYAKQLKEHSNELQISQPFVSRHLASGHTDTASIDQFQFIEEFIPPPWSVKNPVDTNIYQKVRPYVGGGFDLDLDSIVYKIREISYAGDTGYYEIIPTSKNTWDAGGGVLGLEIFYNPPTDFHHNAVVYIYLEMYDQAVCDGNPCPNIIVYEYWFRIIPDYKAPYIENESPDREETDVSVNTNISFDIFDAGVGVDIDTLEFYVNNRRKTPSYSAIAGGYHITYNPPNNFFYGETVEIAVKVDDIRGNTLYDMWRFYCVGSTGPWIDIDSFYPKSCQEGIKRKTDRVSVNVYGIDDTGVDRDSIIIHIGGKERSVKIRPIIYRSS